MRHGDWDVYAQKLNADGTPLWALNGVPVCCADGQQGGVVREYLESLRAVALPDRGTIVAFYDRGRGRSAISCQRLSADGEMLWDSTGVEAGRIMDRDSMFTELWFGLVADTCDGAIVTWPKQFPGGIWQVAAQRVNGAGAVCWDNGLSVCDYGPSSEPPMLRSASDAKGGAVGCWQDTRFGWFSWSVYAQRYGDAPVGLAESCLGQRGARLRVSSNPMRTGASISLPACGEREVTLDLFDACGRKVRRLWQGRAVRAAAVYWARADDASRQEPAGVYVLRLMAGSVPVASEQVTIVR
jgi:hypothetical protein